MLVPELMRAVVVGGPDNADSLQITMVPVPQPDAGQVLVKVHTTTVISSEIATFEGVSMAKLPLILGNDFVGTIVAAPDAEQRIGTLITGGYGGYGYTRNGAWAEYICVDSDDAFPIETSLDNITLAAIPGSFTAASGALHALGDLKGKTLLVRGGTSGVGLAAATMALEQGATVISTTRNKTKAEKLLAHGVHHVVIDDQTVVEQVLRLAPGGVDTAIEMLGVEALRQTVQCIRPFGVVCLTGLLNDQAVSMKSGVREDRSNSGYPHPMELIPPTIRLTCGGVHGTPRTGALVQNWVSGLEKGTYRMPIDSVFSLNDIAAAYTRRADTSCFGKIIITVDVPST